MGVWRERESFPHTASRSSMPRYSMTAPRCRGIHVGFSQMTKRRATPTASWKSRVSLQLVLRRSASPRALSRCTNHFTYVRQVADKTTWEDTRRKEACSQCARSLAIRTHRAELAASGAKVHCAPRCIVVANVVGASVYGECTFKRAICGFVIR